MERKRTRTLVAKSRACSSRCFGLSSVMYHGWEGKYKSPFKPARLNWNFCINNVYKIETGPREQAKKQSNERLNSQRANESGKASIHERQVEPVNNWTNERRSQSRGPVSPLISQVNPFPSKFIFRNRFFPTKSIIFPLKLR